MLFHSRVSVASQVTVTFSTYGIFHFHMDSRCGALSPSDVQGPRANMRHSASCAFVILPLSFCCETSTFTVAVAANIALH